MKILIIEDEILIQSTMMRFLKKHHHSVTGTASGQSAIELLTTENFDTIFCDLMLQDLNGFDILDYSRSKFGINYVKNKFIIMTAYTSTQIQEKAMSYECPILLKPFESLQIVLKLVNNKNTTINPIQI